MTAGDCLFRAVKNEVGSKSTWLLFESRQPRVTSRRTSMEFPATEFTAEVSKHALDGVPHATASRMPPRAQFEPLPLMLSATPPVELLSETPGR